MCFQLLRNCIVALNRQQ